MAVGGEDFEERLSRPEFPRASAYDSRWVLENQMGPNALWLLESLTQRVELTQGMRVLDLGCGRALTSIFLAREFGVQVIAHDYWIGASDNWRRVVEAGVADRVTPVHAEAHSLPFAHRQFDAIVCVDAYHYFGTDDLYLSYLSRFLAPRGLLAIAVPGLREEQTELPPPHLASWWDADFCSFHSPSWWRAHWEKSGRVDVTAAEWLPGGHDLWLAWAEVVDEWAIANGAPPYDFEREQALLRADSDGLLGFSLVTAVAL